MQATVKATFFSFMAEDKNEKKFNAILTSGVQHLFALRIKCFNNYKDYLREMKENL